MRITGRIIGVHHTCTIISLCNVLAGRPKRILKLTGMAVAGSTGVAIVTGGRSQSIILPCSEHPSVDPKAAQNAKRVIVPTIIHLMREDKLPGLAHSSSFTRRIEALLMGRFINTRGIHYNICLTMHQEPKESNRLRAFSTCHRLFMDVDHSPYRSLIHGQFQNSKDLNFQKCSLKTRSESKIPRLHRSRSATRNIYRSSSIGNKNYLNPPNLANLNTSSSFTHLSQSCRRISNSRICRFSKIRFHRFRLNLIKTKDTSPRFLTTVV